MKQSWRHLIDNGSMTSAKSETNKGKWRYMHATSHSHSRVYQLPASKTLVSSASVAKP